MGKIINDKIANSHWVCQTGVANYMIVVSANCNMVDDSSLVPQNEA